jgi:hypothetical protein
LFRGRYDGFIGEFLPSEPRKLAGRPAGGQGKKGGEDGQVGSKEEREHELFGRKFQVENVEEVENGGKNCAQLFLLSALSVVSDFSCQAPIDISISRS